MKFKGEIVLNKILKIFTVREDNTKIEGNLKKGGGCQNLVWEVALYKDIYRTVIYVTASLKFSVSISKFLNW